MTSPYRPRAPTDLLDRAAAAFPAVILTGPRQCGKSTLVRHVFGATHRSVTLGHEVDFLVEDGLRLVPVEAKLTGTPTPRDAEPIERLQLLVGPRAAPGLVVCLVPAPVPLTRTVTAVPLGAY